MKFFRVCFEEEYVTRTLKNSKPKDLAIIDSDGINWTTIQMAKNNDIFVYDYLNAGACESERDYWNDFKDLALAEYNGWKGEYWIDITSEKWKNHLIQQAKEKKANGVDGLYFDNSDIYYMCLEGFKEEKTKMIRKAPSADKVYKALRDVIMAIEDLGLVVMPNGGNDFVERLFDDGYGYLIKTVLQEGVCYTDQKATPKADKKYYTKYLDKMKKRGVYIRIIEYPKTKTQAAKAIAYATLHGWQAMYISYHKDLRGD